MKVGLKEKLVGVVNRYFLFWYLIDRFLSALSGNHFEITRYDQRERRTRALLISRASQFPKISLMNHEMW